VDLGGHAIIAYGFGKYNGVVYWKWINSWGSSWGNNGKFMLSSDDTLTLSSNAGFYFCLEE